MWEKKKQIVNQSVTGLIRNTLMDDSANYPSVHIHVLQFHGTIALFQLHLSTMLIVEGHS